jgi:hypothetical protein
MIEINLRPIHDCESFFILQTIVFNCYHMNDDR